MLKMSHQLEIRLIHDIENNLHVGFVKLN